MKIKLSSIILAVCVAFSLVSATRVAEAYTCRHVNGYWRHGYYHRGHRVCWGNNNYRHCVWRNGVKYCR